MRRLGWALAAMTAVCGPALAEVPLATVPHVDLTRYLGTWHEMARYPNSFQDKDCVNVTAEYGLDEDGNVSVLNTCRDPNGTVTDTATGSATIEDTQSQAKLSVTFFWPFTGDYWVVGLADDYSWAIVSEPSREYLWILTRAPIGPGTKRDELVSKAAELGFDTTKLFFSQREPAGADPT